MRERLVVSAVAGALAGLVGGLIGRAHDLAFWPTWGMVAAGFVAGALAEFVSERLER